VDNKDVTVVSRTQDQSSAFVKEKSVETNS